jgi:hypothetical protein
MLILLRKSLQTTFILLLFITGGTYLHAANLTLEAIESKSLFSSELSDCNLPEAGYHFFADTVSAIKNGIKKNEVIQDDKFTIPDQMAKMPINFRINSTITYLSFEHFVRNESKKMFFQALLKETELHRLSVQADSLRKVYANATSEQKETISQQILQSEKASIVLNEEIPAMYQKAREVEDQYWQTASPDEIVKFQEKIKIYKDSIQQATEMQNRQLTTNHVEIPDTITFYSNSTPKVVEKKAVEPSGIIYKIQIGAFKGKIPESANKLIKKLALIRKVDNYIDDKGVKIYTTGNLRLYNEALTMQNQVKQEGIKNAVITAYQDGKKITVDEAKKINSEP